MTNDDVKHANSTKRHIAGRRGVDHHDGYDTQPQQSCKDDTERCCRCYCAQCKKAESGKESKANKEKEQVHNETKN